MHQQVYTWYIQDFFVKISEKYSKTYRHNPNLHYIFPCYIRHGPWLDKALVILLSENYKASNTLSGATSCLLRKHYRNQTKNNQKSLPNFLVNVFTCFSSLFETNDDSTHMALVPGYVHICPHKPTMKNIPGTIINREELPSTLSEAYV